MVAIAVLGLLAWMQNMYIAPLNEGWTIMAMAFALALAVPIGTLFYVWIATIWGGALELRAADAGTRCSRSRRWRSASRASSSTR